MFSYSNYDIFAVKFVRLNKAEYVATAIRHEHLPKQQTLQSRSLFEDHIMQTYKGGGGMNEYFQILGMLILVNNFQRLVDRRVGEPQDRLDEMTKEKIPT